MIALSKFLSSPLSGNPDRREIFLFLLQPRHRGTVPQRADFLFQIFSHSMLAQFVTAAKGLFTRHPEEHSDPDSVHPTDLEMVTSTRRGEVAPNMSVNGKRKTRPASAGKSDGQETKRQRSKPQATNTAADISSDSDKKSSVNATSETAGKKIRFGSEEPEPIDTQPEEIPEASMEDEEDEDSDDDAPETIDNSAQLSKMKEQAKKQEAARQLYVPKMVAVESIVLTVPTEKNS